MRIALNAAGIRYSEYRYMLEVFVAVEHCAMKAELNELGKSKSTLAKIKESIFSFDRYVDEDGREVEPNPEIVNLYGHSAQFKREADEIHSQMMKIRECQTNAILLHLSRIADENASKAVVSASQWFLERSLPTDFGKQDAEQSAPIAPVKVEFVKCDSPSSLKRLEDMEREILGDRKLA